MCFLPHAGRPGKRLPKQMNSLTRLTGLKISVFLSTVFRDLSNLQPAEKEFIYYLSEAALCGRDILWDQNFKYNLVIRKTIEAIIASYGGDKQAKEYSSFITWAKRVFFANGIHHHYSNDKFVPGFSEEYFATLVKRQ